MTSEWNKTHMKIILMTGGRAVFNTHSHRHSYPAVIICGVLQSEWSLSVQYKARLCSGLAFISCYKFLVCVVGWKMEITHVLHTFVLYAGTVPSKLGISHLI
jgi:hypothetical protein